MNGYSQRILDYAGNSSFAGTMTDADGIGEVGLDSGRQGSTIAVRFFLKTVHRQIAHVRFQAFGCGFTLAACSAAAELAENATLSEVARVDSSAIDRRLGGLPQDRSYCAVLAAEALQAAVKSAKDSTVLVAQQVMATDVHTKPRVPHDHPRYRQLMDSPCSEAIVAADRHLLACLLVVAEEEGTVPAKLGLSSAQCRQLLCRFFPALDFALEGGADSYDRPNVNFDLVAMLLEYVPQRVDDHSPFPAEYLARILAARATCPGHLWVAMGLFERNELTAAIKRHLPVLAAANSQGMRWKRFFYKQLCDRSGGVLCKTPVCGDCPEYSICFTPS